MSVNSLETGGRTAEIPWDQKLSTIQPKPVTMKRRYWNLHSQVSIIQGGSEVLYLLSHANLG